MFMAVIAVVPPADPALALTLAARFRRRVNRYLEKERGEGGVRG